MEVCSSGRRTGCLMVEKSLAENTHAAAGLFRSGDGLGSSSSGREDGADGGGEMAAVCIVRGERAAFLVDVYDGRFELGGVSPETDGMGVAEEGGLLGGAVSKGAVCEEVERTVRSGVAREIGAFDAAGGFGVAGGAGDGDAGCGNLHGVVADDRRAGEDDVASGGGELGSVGVGDALRCGFGGSCGLVVGGVDAALLREGVDLGGGVGRGGCEEEVEVGGGAGAVVGSLLFFDAGVAVADNTAELEGGAGGEGVEGICGEGDAFAGLVADRGIGEEERGVAGGRGLLKQGAVAGGGGQGAVDRVGGELTLGVYRCELDGLGEVDVGGVVAVVELDEGCTGAALYL